MRREAKRVGPGRRRAAAALAAAILACALGAGYSWAQTEAVDDPGPAIDQNTGQPVGDTDVTPDPDKPQDHWHHVAGARFGEDHVDPEVSPTPFEADFYTVAFGSKKQGFAAGVLHEQCDGADRVVPVIYRYSVDSLGDERWEEHYRGVCDSPGFVGAIAWRSDGSRAMAVGGTGRYPLREHERLPGESDGEYYARDEAGSGRAWSYDPKRYGDEDWHELDLTNERTQGMRGMTALAFDPALDRDGGAAGALAQLWMIDDGAFVERIDAQSPSARIYNRLDLRYRVRQLRFVSYGTPQAFGVTSGCCTGTPELDEGKLLAYDGIRWYVRGQGADLQDGTRDYSLDETFERLAPGVAPPVDDARPREPHVRQHPLRADGLYALFAQPPPGSPGRSVFQLSVVATGSGPQENDSKTGSTISQAFCADGRGQAGQQLNFGLNAPTPSTSAGPVLQPVEDATRVNVSSVRLYAADGDAAFGAFYPHGSTFGERIDGSPSTLSGLSRQGYAGVCSGYQSWETTDGLPDWAVGGTSSADGDHPDGQAVGVATATRISPKPGLFDQPDTTRPTDVEPPAPEQLQAYVRSQYFLLPTYTLYAMQVLEGTGWAVGQHGAIVKLSAEPAAGTSGESGSTGALGTTGAAALPDRSPYESLEPRAIAASGTLPSLEQRPWVDLSEPTLVGAGSPDPDHGDGLNRDVSSIVMSRDGSEGWAVGPRDLEADGPYQRRMTSLYHYRNGHWTTCDVVGIPGQAEADQACASLAGLLRWRDGTEFRSVALYAAARVPLERDGDPSNDDDFEVVAVGSPYLGPSEPKPAAAILRYRDGRWALEKDRTARTDFYGRSGIPVDYLRFIAFTAPDDGWAVAQQPYAGNVYLYHYDGAHWTDCDADQQECGLDLAVTDFVTERGSAVPAASVDDRVEGLAASGDRVWLYGSRNASDGTTYPMIVVHDRGQPWTGDPAMGGLDPAGGEQRGAPSGKPGVVRALSVRETSDGYDGMAIGVFDPAVNTQNRIALARQRIGATPILRLRDGRWQPGEAAGALQDYLSESDRRTQNDQRTSPLALLLGDGTPVVAQMETGRLMRLDRTDGGWDVIPGRRPYGIGGAGKFTGEGTDGPIQAIAPDGANGFWVAVRNQPRALWFSPRTANVHFFHYTARVRAPILEEAPHPLASGSHFTALAGEPDGTVWAGTDTGRVWRYDRLTGWDGVGIRGWDPGRLVTRPSPVTALSVGDDGAAVVVGPGGRIADVDRRGSLLNPAAARLCDESSGIDQGCGTPNALRAVSAGPGGAALVGGDRATLLYRPPGKPFAPIPPPDVDRTARFVGVALPSADRAWIATQDGSIFAGTRVGERTWSWRHENVTADEQLVGASVTGVRPRLTGLAIGPDGHGYAIGDDGVLLERREGPQPWRRIATDLREDLTSVVLVQGTGQALLGAHNGAVLTVSEDGVHVARHGDYDSATFGELTGPVVGLAAAPGSEDGALEIWAATSGADDDAIPPRNAADQLWHYASDPDDPATNPGRRADALPDAPAPRAGEVSFAVFGNTGCAPPDGDFCQGANGTTSDHEVISQRVAATLAATAGTASAPSAVLFTGDAVGQTSNAGSTAVEEIARDSALFDGPIKFRRWLDFVANPIRRAGIPLLGALGPRDLSDLSACSNASPPPRCLVLIMPGVSNTHGAVPGENLMWRNAFAGQASPWGAAEATAELRPVGVSGREAPGGGARTHYAADLVREGRVVTRIVVLDTSLKSFATADAVQNPVELETGGRGWLDAVLCEQPAKGCTRPQGLPLIVVSSVPTYAVGQEAATETLRDGASLEDQLLRGRATAVVSGHVGWNWLYWTMAAALHCPQPGEPYPRSAPNAVGGSCDGRDVQESSRTSDSVQGQEAVAAALRGLGAPAPPVDLGAATGTGVLPTVVSGSAGHPVQDENGPSSAGNWHGYSVVRLDGSGDPAKTVVEQRPVLDWIDLRSATHVVRAGQRIRLQGVGREPLRISTADRFAVRQIVRYVAIDSPAITHRFDLLAADPERPWLPERDADGEQVQLDPSVATVDDQTGVVTAGRSHPRRTYAIAVLSVGPLVASRPLVFEPRRSAAPPRPPRLATPAVPAVRVLGFNAQTLQPPPATPASTPPPPLSVGLQLPAPPALPGVPPITLSPIAPAAPPAPPAPPAGQHVAPLDLPVAPVGVTVPPTTGVTAQPTPPANPAPPSGARREARQRQAATAKSEESASEIQSAGGDTAADGPNGPPGMAMTRYETSLPAGASMHAAPRRSQPSAWVVGLEWSGAITLLALALAAGWVTVRPTPDRRRSPGTAALVWVRRR